MQLKQGTTLQSGRFKIISCIGDGGFGITYLVTDERLGREVVLKEYFPDYMVRRDTTVSLEVKTLNPEFSGEFHEGIRKFLKEAKTLAQFNHIPAIANVHDFFEENNTAYIVMDYIKGQSLKQYIKSRKTPYTFSEALNLITPCMEALQQVHQAGIIHRDFAPDNILIDEKGKVTIIDFGASRDFVANNATMTIMVKHGYAPVEQYSNAVKQGTYTDVYSLGAIIYEMLTLKKPDPAVDRIFSDPLVRPEVINPLITEAQSAVVMKGLSVSYEMRYQNVEEFLSALRYAEKENPSISLKPQNTVLGNTSTGLVRQAEPGQATELVRQNMPNQATELVRQNMPNQSTELVRQDTAPYEQPYSNNQWNQYNQPAQYNQVYTYNQQVQYIQPAQYNQQVQYSQPAQYNQQVQYSQPHAYSQQGQYGQQAQYGQWNQYSQQQQYSQQNQYGQQVQYNQPAQYSQPTSYNQQTPYGHQTSYGQNHSYPQSAGEPESLTPGKATPIEQANIRHCNPGDLVRFGKYEWNVLSKRDNMVLLVSASEVTKSAYNTWGGSTAWENSTLRRWLNEDFYNEFTENERSAIAVTSIENGNNPKYGLFGGTVTEDRVFVLSIDEANRYFYNNDARALSTLWWLRSPGGAYNLAAYVDTFGNICEYGTNASYDRGAVRPAIWVNFK